MELSWALDRAYGFSRDRIATVFEELVGTEELLFEAADDVIRSAEGYRRGGAGRFRPEDRSRGTTIRSRYAPYARSSGGSASRGCIVAGSAFMIEDDSR